MACPRESSNFRYVIQWEIRKFVAIYLLYDGELVAFLEGIVKNKYDRNMIFFSNGESENQAKIIFMFTPWNMFFVYFLKLKFKKEEKKEKSIFALEKKKIKK